MYMMLWIALQMFIFINMTVQELIDKLNEAEDKSIPVYVCDRALSAEIFSISIHDTCVEIC